VKREHEANVLQALLHNIPDPIYFKDRDHRFVAVSMTKAEHWQTTPEDLIGKTDFDFFDEATAEQAHTDEQQVMETGQVLLGKEEVVTYPDGSQRWYSVTKAPYYDAEGEIVGIVSISRDITDAKLAEARLRDSEEKYRGLSENLQDVIVQVSLEGVLRYVSLAIQRLTGHDPEALLGQPATDFVVEEDRARVARALKEAAEGQPAQDMEVEVLAADGRHLPVEVTTFPIVEEGEIVAFQCVLRDITGRKQAEERLAKLNECFLSFGADPSENIKSLVALAGELLGAACALYNRLDGGMLVSAGQWHTAPDYNPVGEPDGHICYDVIKQGGDQLLVIRKLPETPYWQTDPNVQRYNLQTYVGKAVSRGDEYIGSLCLVYQEDFEPDEGQKELMGIMASAIGVEEERKQAEETLRESEERYHMIADRVSDVIWIMDMDLHYTYVNPSGARGRGYSVEELMAQTVEDALTPASLEVAMTAWEEELTLENMEGKDPDRSRALELEFTCKDGSTRWGEVTVTFLHDANGQLTGILGVTRDITDRKHTEEQLRRAQKMEAVGTLAAGIAHDFNNMLQTLIVRAQLMLMTGDFDAETATNLREMISTGSRGASLVQRLLVFSRRIEPRKQIIHLEKPIEDVRLILERTISKLITIETDVQEGLWHVEADPYQMEQVLLNMGINAAEAMPGGGVLKMAAENLTLAQQDAELSAGRYVVLSVSDTGMGIGEEHLEHIIEPFYTSKGHAEHSGLGLAIVHGIVESHDGFLRVSSEPGVGTTCQVYLPVAESIAPVEEVGKESAVIRGPLTVLVVDDEAAVARLLCDVLENFGHHTFKALDGEEGLEIFRAHHEEIDVVLLDLIMPKLEGERCLEEMLAIDPEVVVVIATGFFLDDAARERLEPKIRGFLTKPFEVWDVLHAVHEAAYEHRGPS